MRLRDLNAVFISAPQDGGGHCRLSGPEGAQGIMFQCPLCAVGKERDRETGHLVGVHWVRIWFANAIDAPPAPPALLPSPRWSRSGLSLDDLGLSPSVHLLTGCGWHGYVMQGGAA